MNDAAESSTPFDDVRELAMRDIEPDAACSKKVHEALLGMGRQGDFGKLGQAAEWLAGWIALRFLGDGATLRVSRMRLLPFSRAPTG